MLTVTAHFLDGGRIEGGLDAEELPSGDFSLFVRQPKLKLVRVPVEGLKYLVVWEEHPTISLHDPRQGTNLQKLVLQFVDGTFMHTYHDEYFADAGRMLHVRLWNPSLSTVIRAAISKSSLENVSPFSEANMPEVEPRSVSRPFDRTAVQFVYAPKDPIPTGEPFGPASAMAVDPKLRQLTNSYQLTLSRIIPNPLDSGTLEEAIREKLPVLMEKESLTEDQREGVANLIVQEAVGYGAVDPLIKDPSVTEIMVNGANEIYFERGGVIFLSDLTFYDNNELAATIHKLVEQVGRRIDESSPMVDARLADGSRLNAVLPPISPGRPILTIRKFSALALTMEDLMRETTLSPSMALFLQGAVRGRANILISGGAGAGKTTTMNILGSMIPTGQRVITIEDSVELKLNHPHVVTLECRPENVEGLGELNVRELLRNSLRMRPDRILIGEVRGAESLDMLQAMNTGHDGSMSTIHANSATEALSRLETMVMAGSGELPVAMVRSQVSSSINLFIHQARMIDGTRRILQIAEFLHFGLEESPRFEVIYRFVPEGDAGWFEATGVVPRVVEKMALYDSVVSSELFDPELTRSPVIGRSTTEV